jgi:hypothetical protein
MFFLLSLFKKNCVQVRNVQSIYKRDFIPETMTCFFDTDNRHKTLLKLYQKSFQTDIVLQIFFRYHIQREVLNLVNRFLKHNMIGH